MNDRLRPFFEGNDEIGCTVYPTRRVQAVQANSRVLFVWRLARVEWFEGDYFGTSWDAIEREIVEVR